MSRLGRRRGLLGPEGLSTSRQSSGGYGMAEIPSPAGRYSTTTVRQNGGAILCPRHTQISQPQAPSPDNKFAIANKSPPCGVINVFLLVSRRILDLEAQIPKRLIQPLQVHPRPNAKDQRLDPPLPQQAYP